MGGGGIQGEGFGEQMYGWAKKSGAGCWGFSAGGQVCVGLGEIFGWGQKEDSGNDLMGGGEGGGIE